MQKERWSAAKAVRWSVETIQALGVSALYADGVICAVIAPTGKAVFLTSLETQLGLF
jgi:hypothetical protein